MANVALQLTGQFPPSTRIPFLQYSPVNTSVKRPLMIWLHGQGEGSSTHNTTSVLSLQNSGSGGTMWLTNSANGSTGGILPAFTHPITGESFEYYVLAPQLYYPPGVTSGVLWDDRYIHAMLDYAKANLNVDMSRCYLTGYSLGCGGTITACFNSTLTARLAAVACTSPGYGNISTGNHQNIARSGIPVWLCHAADDGVAGVTVSDQIYSRTFNNDPLMVMRYDRYLSGGHGVVYRLFNTTDGRNYPASNGFPDIIHNPNVYRWFLLWKKADPTPPLFYVP